MDVVYLENFNVPCGPLDMAVVNTTRETSTGWNTTTERVNLTHRSNIFTIASNIFACSLCRKIIVVRWWMIKSHDHLNWSVQQPATGSGLLGVGSALSAGSWS